MNEVVIDTSVWIDHFKGHLLEPARSIFRELVENERAIITGVIRYELLVGARTQKEFETLLDFTSVLRTVTIEASQNNDLALFGWSLQKKGLLGSFSDVSIAFAAKANNLPVFSFDAYFKKLATKGIIQRLDFAS